MNPYSLRELGELPPCALRRPPDDLASEKNHGSERKPCVEAGRDDAGVVTSLKEEHENSASRIFSNDRDCLAPHVHSRRAKGSVRPCRNEMTLDVESVVGGCVS